MSKKTARIFFDANVLIQTGKHPGSPILARVIDLVRGGFIDVLTTDLTKIEIAKKRAKNDREVIKEIGRSHFRRIAKDITGVELPAITKTEIYDKLFKKYSKETEEMFSSLGARTLSIDSVSPSQVFSSYSHETGFFSGEGKKDQFPDAFIFECLKEEASETSPVIIVSDDDDFSKPSEFEKNLSVIKSILELFAKFGFQVDAPDIDGFLEAHSDELLELVNIELKNWGLQVSDVEDAEIDETSVTEVEMVDLISFGKTEKGDDILVVGRIKMTVNVSYTHPNWDTASYDSEDKVLLPFENVDGETEIEVEAAFSMSILVDDAGKPEQIEDLRFTNDDFVWVDLHQAEEYR